MQQVRFDGHLFFCAEMEDRVIDKEPRIFATTFRFTKTFSDYVHKWPEGESFADKLENIVLTVKNAETEIQQLEEKKKSLQEELMKLEGIKAAMQNTVESLDRLQQVLNYEPEEKEQVISGHALMGEERFMPEAKHMIVMDVLSDESSVGFKNERLRLFLSNEGYGNAKEAEKIGHIKIIGHAAVTCGKLYFDKPIQNSPLEKELAARIKGGGFSPERQIINGIFALDSLFGKKHSVKEICEKFKDKQYASADEENIVNELVVEFKRQELTRNVCQER